MDKKRPKKGSNKEWVNPNEPDAEIMKMKSGGTDMAHKAEHAVDMSGEGAVIAVTLHGGAKGDTKSLPDTLEKAQSNLQELANNAECCERIQALLHDSDNPKGISKLRFWGKNAESMESVS